VNRERGEGGVKAGCSRVHTRRGTDNPECRQPLPVCDQERDGGRHDSTASIPVGVAEKQFVVQLWTCR